MIEILKKWEEHGKQLEAVYQKYYKLTGASPECELFYCVFKSYESYTDCLSQLVGDKEEWLSWYAFENDYGKNNFNAIVNGKNIIVDNVEKLLHVIHGE